MLSVQEIKTRVEAAVSGAQLTVLTNESSAGQHSLVVDHKSAEAVARFRRWDWAWISRRETWRRG